MNLFGIGEGELILILVVMLVVAGPKRMIRWSYVIGQYAGKLRAMWRDAVVVMQKELDTAGVDVKLPQTPPTPQTLRRELNRQAQKAMQPVTQPLQAANRELRDTLTEPVVNPPAVVPEPVKEGV